MATAERFFALSFLKIPNKPQMRNEQVGEKRHSLLNILYEQQGENGMKLRIIDEFWAVGKKTRRVGKMLKPLCAGRIEGQHGCFWMLSDVRKDSAHVAYHRADGTLIREWDLKKGEKVLYRPRSFDGGHQYTLKIVRFF